MNSRRPIGITTGDPDGIGLEVTLKAFKKALLSPKQGFVVFVCSDLYIGKYPARVQKIYREQRTALVKFFIKNFDTAICSSLGDLLSSKGRYPQITLVLSDESPPRWVEQVAEAARQGTLSGLVTGPLSKTLVKRDGFRDLGHTDILKRITKSKYAFMSFWGSDFNVVLLSGHIPVGSVPKVITPSLVKAAVKLTQEVCRKLQMPKPLAIVGINPHAGEAGMIGKEDLKVSRSLKHLKGVHSHLLVPDVAFQRQNWPRYSAYLCPYHDQGLIPFKMIHGQNSGAHLTLGIPIIRTSVDHGTAKDIFGKNKATPNSMIDAIKLCIKLCNSK